MARIAVIVASVAVLAVPTSAMAAADCRRQVDDVADFGAPLKDPIVLSPEEGSEQRLRNFDGNRGVKEYRDIRLKSDKRLPDELTAARIGFSALIERGDDKLESVDFPDPTFTQPRIASDRRHIVFTMCLNAKGLSPGKYVGSVTVAGPEGLGEARIGITANLKARFRIWFALALGGMLLAGAALFFKDRTRDKNSITGGWWFKTVGTLFVAFGALAAVYLNDPTWGASTFASAIALMGTALASVGGRKLID